jgi:hypothetical protein
MSSTSPISEAQLNANRQNSTNSTGPRTDTAKKRTRLNGLTHGLTGQTVVMPHENREIYENFCAQQIACLQPINDTERALAHSIADDSWKLNRARAIEENIFALAEFTAPDNLEDSALQSALTQAQTYLDHAREIQLLTAYAGRIARSLAKTKAELTALQAERKRAHAQALEEALLLAQLAKSKGEIYNPDADPSQNGFGFSTAEIYRLLDRNSRLEQARQLVKSRLNPSRKAA